MSDREFGTPWLDVRGAAARALCSDRTILREARAGRVGHLCLWPRSRPLSGRTDGGPAMGSCAGPTQPTPLRPGRCPVRSIRLSEASVSPGELPRQDGDCQMQLAEPGAGVRRASRSQVGMWAAPSAAHIPHPVGAHAPPVVAQWRQ